MVIDDVWKSLLNGVPNVPTCPTFPRGLRALRALRVLCAHAPYVLYVPTCPSIFYKPENKKMETFYSYFFTGTEFNFGP